jgi:hypothetical protein
MKVYSLYHKDGAFLAAFPDRDMCVNYAKIIRPNEDPWDYNIVEEYLSKSPLTYSSPLTSLTPQQTIPCNPDITVLPGTPKINPDPYPHIYCDGTK